MRTEFNPPGEVAAGCVPADGVALQWVNSQPAPPNDKGVAQLAYEVQLFGSPAAGAVPPLWGSGKVSSAAQSLVVASTDAFSLPHESTLYWRARVWLASASGGGASDGPSGWSAALAFDTAPAPASWANVSWVGGHNQLRAAFAVGAASPIKRARVYAAGMGAFYLWVNGQRASDAVMDPPQSVYPQRTLHASYDVTALLRPGASNVVGVQLGNYKWGYDDVWCNMTASGGADGCRALALRLVVEYEDDAAAAAAAPDTTVLVTSAGAGSPWVGRQGPVSWDHLFHGETFDARLEVAGWARVADVADLPAATGSSSSSSVAWQPVTVVTPAAQAGASIGGFGPLVPTNVPPLRATETLAPVRAWSVPRAGYGDWGATRAVLFDFGKNSAGMTTLRLRAEEVAALLAKGVRSLQIEHAEITDAPAPLGSTYNTYCGANVPAAGDVHVEPCQVHQVFPPGGGHLTPGRYIGDFNNANMTNVYVLDPNQTNAAAANGGGVEYTALFAAAGFRYAKVLGLPDGFVPTLAGAAPTLSARFVHTDVRPIGQLKLAPVNAPPGPAPPTPLPPLPPTAPAVCGAATELTGPLLLGGCPGGALIKEITFVSYGTPSGDCGSAGFRADSACDAGGARAVLDQLCVGKASCSVGVSSGVLNGGVDPCRGQVKALAVLLRCVGAPLPPPPAPPAPVPGFPDVLNAIHEMTRRAQLSNLWSVPTDCPQRERRGWMGDAQVSCDEAMLSFDMQAFYRKFLRDVADDQRRGCQASAAAAFAGRCEQWEDGRYNGSVADVVPYDGVGGWPGCAVWQVAYIVIARTHWRHYGDAALLAEHWEGLVAMMGYFERNVNPASGLLEQGCYGDWVDPGGHNPSTVTPAGSVSAFYFAQAYGQLSEIAAALGNAADATAYGTKHNVAVRAYHARYYDAQAGGYSPVVGQPTGSPNNAPNGSQTSNAMALTLGAPQSADATGALAARVAANLAADVEARGNHSFGGIVGQRWIYPALEAAGYGAHALATLCQDSFPSFGHMAAQNQTTLCENWACGAHNAGGGSLNHIMYGGFDGWMTTALGGLDTVSNATTTGWRVLTVRPLPAAIATLGRASASVETRLGAAAVAWRFEQADGSDGGAAMNTMAAERGVPAGGGHLSLNVTVPVGAVAELHVPATLALALPGGARAVVHLGAVADARSGALLVSTRTAPRRDADALVFVVGSGVHEVSAQFGPQPEFNASS